MFKSIITAIALVATTATASFANGQVSAFCDGWCDGSEWTTADTVTLTVEGVETKISFYAEVKGVNESRIKTIRVDGENLDIKSSLTRGAKIKAGHEEAVVTGIARLVSDAVNYRDDNHNGRGQYGFQASVSGSRSHLHVFQDNGVDIVSRIESGIKRPFFAGIKGGDRKWDALLDSVVDRAVRWTD